MIDYGQRVPGNGPRKEHNNHSLRPSCNNLSRERMYPRQLLLGNNQLKKLPYSVGFLTNLTTLQVRRTCLCSTLALLKYSVAIASTVSPTQKSSEDTACDFSPKKLFAEVKSIGSSDLWEVELMPSQHSATLT